MATPKLNTGNAGAAPLRTLRPSGAAPTKQPTLKSATGKKIAPKKAAPAPKTSAPKPEAAKTPAEEKPIEAEQIPATPPADDAAAQAAAEAEAARLAQEEYERQMEEYNRQMEEYNRQMAALQAAEEQASAETASSEAAEAAQAAQALVTEEQPDVPTPTEKLRAAKSAKTKSNLSVTGAKKKKKATTDDEAQAIDEEELAQREAYMRAIMEEEERKPIWKTPPFMIGAGLLVVTIGICTVLVVQKQAENARIQAHIDYTNDLLRRAQQINMKGVENLADAAKKQVDVSCSMADAKALMEVVVDPFVLGENGKPRYGARAEGVAQNACLLLGLAAEKDDAIRDMIFDTMGKQCVKIKPTLFHWLLQRVAISDAKGVNAGLKKLAQAVADKKTAKPWQKKTQYLSYIWECIGLRVTAADTKEILDLLKSDIADNTLAPNLCNCLDNILMMMDDPKAKADLGDEIFINMPEKLRTNAAMASTLARACSPKAMLHYKEEITSKGWSGTAPIFMGAWGSDDVLEFILEQKEANADKPKVLSVIDDVLGTVIKQNRPRSMADAEKLLNMCFTDPFGDTSGIQDIINKTDPISTLYIGDTHPDLPKLQEELKKLEALRKQKQQIIRVLGSLSDHEWVVATLKKYAADKDDNIQYDAERALEKTHDNAVREAQMREAYQKRNKG